MTINHPVKRKPMRLESWDYSLAGCYFVTICIEGRAKWFGDVVNDGMQLSGHGNLVRDCWLDLPNHYDMELDVYIVMPNHIHGIIVMPYDNEGKKRHGLSEIVRGFKTFSSKSINKELSAGRFSWQRSFYDHVIRNDEDMARVQEYIVNNPMQWALDEENPERERTGRVIDPPLRTDGESRCV